MKKLLLLMVFTTFCIMLSVSIFAFDNIESGNSWDNVKEVQQMLIELGYLDGIVDGSFGPATEQAVINFQADSGLAANGIVG